MTVPVLEELITLLGLLPWTRLCRARRPARSHLPERDRELGHSGVPQVGHTVVPQVGHIGAYPPLTTSLFGKPSVLCLLWYPFMIPGWIPTGVDIVQSFITGDISIVARRFGLSCLRVRKRSQVETHLL